MNSPLTRTERDSLGEITVPEEALYGAQTQRAIENFHFSGEAMPSGFIQALGLIKSACARANGKLGRLPESLAQAIQEAAAEVADGRHYESFPVDRIQTGSGTSTNMNANEVIARLAEQRCGTKIHPNDHVNLGQSSNDVIPSAIHISSTLLAQQQLLPGLQSLERVLGQKVEAFRSIPKTGRTHLMDAMPLTVGQEFSAWHQQVHHAHLNILHHLKALQGLALGGTAVGTGVNVPNGFVDAVMAELHILTGVEFRQKPNTFEAISCQDSALAFSGALSQTAVALSKLAEDLRWLSSGPLCGLNEVRLPALQPGSSIMPGKVNPVMLEAVLMACTEVLGNHTTISMAAKSGNFQLNTMLPLIASKLLNGITLLANSAWSIATKVLPGISTNEAVLQKNLEKNPVLVTALTDLLGYDKAAKIAKKAYETGRPLKAVVLEDTTLDETQVDERFAELTKPSK